MRTKILSIKGNWREVVDDCRTTVGKGELGKDPSEKFKRAILMAEHSPIRNIHVRWQWPHIKSWIATHWARHKFEKFIQTQRTDRTGIDRDALRQDAEVIFTGEANAQHLIDAWRKRLCMTAAAETRQYAIDFKKELYKLEPEIADALVPNCIYRGGCPEMNTNCNHWKNFSSELTKEQLCDLQTRYYVYNIQFHE